MSCPTLIDLLNHLRQQTAATESAAIEAHLATPCPTCRENQEWLAAIAQLKAGDQSFEAPGEIIQWAVAQFRVAAATFPTAATKLHQLLAELVFDSGATQRLAGVRSELSGGEPASPRRLLYHVQGYDIDLRFSGASVATAEEMVGQVLPEQGTLIPSDGVTVRLLQADLELARTLTDSSGMFVFTSVPEESFDLQIDVSEGVIWVQQIKTARNA